jgi:hypothetical protein
MVTADVIFQLLFFVVPIAGSINDHGIAGFHRKNITIDLKRIKHKPLYLYHAEKQLEILSTEYRKGTKIEVIAIAYKKILT